jgi:hypothetical protein
VPRVRPVSQRSGPEIDAETDQQRRHDEVVRPVVHQHDRHEGQPTDDRQQAFGPPLRYAVAKWIMLVLRRDEKGRDQVGDQSEAAGKGAKKERPPDSRTGHAQVVGEPARHTEPLLSFRLRRDTTQTARRWGGGW